MAKNFSFLDATVQQLDDRFDRENTGLYKYRKLQSILRTGVVDHDVTATYPEINDASTSLEIELRMFRHQNKYTCSSPQKLSK